MRDCLVQLMEKRKNFTFFSMYRKVEADELRFNARWYGRLDVVRALYRLASERYPMKEGELKKRSESYLWH